MPFSRRLLLFSCLILLTAQPSQAQRSGSLPCPKPARQHTHVAAPEAYLELSAGLSTPIMYHNDGGSLGASYRFNARLAPYATATGYLVLSGRMEAFIGIGITQSWQGLGYTDARGDVIKCYTGSLLLTVPVGISYRLGTALWLNAAPYLTLSRHFSSTESFGSSNTSAAFYVYDAPDDKQRIISGLSLGLDLRITRQFGLKMTCVLDAGHSTASYATAGTGGGNGADAQSAVLQPYLLHLGAGLTYKIRRNGE